MTYELCIATIDLMSQLMYVLLARYSVTAQMTVLRKELSECRMQMQQAVAAEVTKREQDLERQSTEYHERLARLNEDLVATKAGIILR